MLVLPDVSIPKTQADWGSQLPKVGMSEIELPIHYHGQTLPAQVDFFVNLKQRQARGIHMSRLYNLLIQELASQEWSLQRALQVLQSGVSSQLELSDSAFLEVRFQLPVRRESLKSGLQGWRIYPVSAQLQTLAGKIQLTLTSSVLYSSTCPASAALAWQLHAQQNQPLAFGATPHAQRSEAQVSVAVSPENPLKFEELIAITESALGTPVQTLVKREDEQEFARLNAENLMFCEDAARKIQRALEQNPQVLNFWGTVKHQESLHPHNAQAYFSKNP